VQARYHATTSTDQSSATLAEHDGCVVATVSKLPRKMRNSQFDPQERIPCGWYYRYRLFAERMDPDLAPVDFFLFPRLKSIMTGTRFADVAVI
jgi:hypothetical protein